MPFTDILDRSLLVAAFGGVPYSPPETLYVALSTTTPTQSSRSNWNFTEPFGGDYDRVPVTNNTTHWPANGSPSVGYEVANGITVRFPIATGDWGIVTYFGIWDAPTGGTLTAFGQLAAPQSILSDAAPWFPPRSLVVVFS